MPDHRALILAIDQGTTGTTVLVVDATGKIVGRGYRELPQIFPQPGWVEHDPEAIWASVLGGIADATRDVDRNQLAGIGITNQRETTIVWERAGGRPIANGIVWQDRRTEPLCARLRDAGREDEVHRRTGLVIDPYFSATKLAWLLETRPELQPRAAAGDLAFGTVDSFLVWRLSGGLVHATDVSNASRTLLLDLERLTWSDEMEALFGIPRPLLPEVRDSAGVLGTTRGVPGIPDGVPIAGVAGDQQAALYGQGCTSPGDAKCTYGTGAFLLMNVGSTPVLSRHRLLGTVGWRIGAEVAYALEGSAFIAGALVQWLRDGLGLIARAAEVEALARQVPSTDGVTIVPALAGLGAPYWRADARGLIRGITRGTTRAHLARAALEAIALQIHDLAQAMAADANGPLHTLRVDGGAAANDLLMQMQADLLDVEVFRPDDVELTALGAARLAARGVGLETTAPAASDRGQRFVPARTPEARAWSRDAIERWRQAVAVA